MQLHSAWPPLNVPGERLGIPVTESQPLLQSDCFKELVNKLAWAIGSTYEARYNNVRTPARQLAIAMAQVLVRRQGYPAKIGYPQE